MRTEKNIRALFTFLAASFAFLTMFAAFSSAEAYYCETKTADGQYSQITLLPLTPSDFKAFCYSNPERSSPTPCPQQRRFDAAFIPDYSEVLSKTENPLTVYNLRYQLRGQHGDAVEALIGHLGESGWYRCEPLTVSHQPAGVLRRCQIMNLPPVVYLNANAGGISVTCYDDYGQFRCPDKASWTVDRNAQGNPLGEINPNPSAPDAQVTFIPQNIGSGSVYVQVQSVPCGQPIEVRDASSIQDPLVSSVSPTFTYVGDLTAFSVTVTQKTNPLKCIAWSWGDGTTVAAKPLNQGGVVTESKQYNNANYYDVKVKVCDNRQTDVSACNDFSQRQAGCVIQTTRVTVKPQRTKPVRSCIVDPQVDRRQVSEWSVVFNAKCFSDDNKQVETDCLQVITWNTDAQSSRKVDRGLQVKASSEGDYEVHATVSSSQRGYAKGDDELRFEDSVVCEKADFIVRDTPVLTTCQVIPRPKIDIQVGFQGRFTVQCLDQRGRPLEQGCPQGSTYSWSLSTTSYANISSNGALAVVTGKSDSRGTETLVKADLTYRLNNQPTTKTCDSSKVYVVSGSIPAKPVYSCVLNPENASLRWNEEKTFQATCKKTVGGQSTPVTCPVLTWSTDIAGGVMTPVKHQTQSTFKAPNNNARGVVQASYTAINIAEMSGEKTLYFADPSMNSFKCTAAVTVSSGGGVVKTCEFTPPSITIPSTGTQTFLVTCKDNGAQVRCPDALYNNVTTTVVGGSITGKQRQGSGGNQVRATLKTQNAQANQQGKKVFASGDGYSCNAPVTVTGGVAPVQPQYSCSLAPSSATVRPGGSQAFTASCSKVVNGAWTPYACPTLYWSTTVQGTIGASTPPGQAPQNSLNVRSNAPEGSTGVVKASFTVSGGGGGVTARANELSFADTIECTASVRVSSGGGGTAVSCLISPVAGVIPQGGAFNFVASCFDVANPLSLGAAINQHRVDCPAQMTWTTALSGVTLYSPGAVGNDKVNLIVAGNAPAPQSGKLKIAVGGPGNKQIQVTPPAQQAGASPSPSPRGSVNPLLPLTGGAGASRASELSFAETQPYLECEVPINITSSCVSGWKTETHSLAPSALVRVGDFEFKLEDLSATRAIVFARTAAPTPATNWDLCGNRVVCEIPLGGTLEMPISVSSDKIKAKVTFQQFVSGAQQVDRTARAVLKIVVVCPKTEPYCEVKPNPALGTGPFSQAFTVDFKNVFGDAVTQPPFKATVSCRDDADVAPNEALVTQSGSGGSASFTCGYPSVQTLTYFTARASFGGAACTASVKDNPSGGSGEPGVPQILAPKEGDEVWSNRATLRFVVPGTGYYSCQYALYNKNGGKLFDVGAVPANAEKTVEFAVVPSGYWIRVRCATALSTAKEPAAWKQSQMVRFLVFEPDRPILVAPENNYRHFGPSTPFKAKFKVKGTQASYSCYYVLDGKAFNIGTVPAGEKEFFIGGLEPQVWTHGQKHLWSVRCASPTSARVTPAATSAPTATTSLQWSCSISPPSATVPNGGSQRFEAQCARSNAEVNCPSGITWATNVAGGTMSPTTGAASTLSIRSALAGAANPSGLVKARYSPASGVGASGVNAFECSASVNGGTSGSDTQAGASLLEFTSGQSWPGVAPNEKESEIRGFYSYEADKPGIIVPVEGGTYNSPVELAFVVGGSAASFECKPAFDGVDENSMTVNAGEENKVYKALNSGDHNASVKCKAVVTGASTGTAPQWISSGDVNFKVINQNQPVIVSPREGELIGGRNVTFAFKIGGDYLAYDCRGYLKSLGITPFQKDVDFGRVTRESCALPKTFSKTVSDVPLGKYEAKVFCAPVTAIPCEPLTGDGYASPTPTPSVTPTPSPTPSPSPSATPSPTPTPSPSPSATPTPSAPPAQGLVGYWKFDETSGALALDSSGNGNNAAGYLRAGVTHTAGRIGGAVHFDGSADAYLDVSSAFDLRNGFALTGWVNIESSFENFPIMTFKPQSGNDKSIELKIDSGKKYDFWTCALNVGMCIYSETLYSQTSYEQNAWKHVAIVYSPNEPQEKKRIYVDGILHGTQNKVASLSNSGLNFGGRYGADKAFIGKLDEVKVFNRPLTDAEVRAEYQRGGGLRGASELFFAEGEGVWSDPVNFELAEGGTPFLNAPLVTSPESGHSYPGDGVQLAFVATGSSNYASFECSKTLDGATTSIAGVALNGVSFVSNTELSGLSIGAHALNVTCRNLTGAPIEVQNTSDTVRFEMLGGTPTPTPPGGGGGGGGGGGCIPCTTDANCGVGSVCAAGCCAGCLCLLDGYCNPCCLAGTDKDCGATTKAQETLSRVEKKTPESEGDFKWPPAAQPGGVYSLSLKCAVGESKRVTAKLALDGTPACDPNMRLTVKGKNLAPDAAACAATGEHYFDVSGLEPGDYTAKATSLGGSTATCKLALAAAGFAFEWWMLLILAVIVVALAAGGYYYYENYYKKGKEGKGGEGVAAEEGGAGEETTDLLEEA